MKRVLTYPLRHPIKTTVRAAGIGYAAYEGYKGYKWLTREPKWYELDYTGLMRRYFLPIAIGGALLDLAIMGGLGYGAYRLFSSWRKQPEKKKQRQQVKKSAASPPVPAAPGRGRRLLNWIWKGTKWTGKLGTLGLAGYGAYRAAKDYLEPRVEDAIYRQIFTRIGDFVRQHPYISGAAAGGLSALALVGLIRLMSGR